MIGIKRNKLAMLGVIGSMMGGGLDNERMGEPIETPIKPKPFGRPLPKGLKVYEVEMNTKEEGIKVKFIVAAMNQKNADRKFGRLFSDLEKLAEDKGDNVMDEDIQRIKRKHFKYADYEHVL